MSRANGYTSYRGSSTARPTSAELVDLHVYIVPPDIWRERYNNLLNQSVTETISAGIIRVHPEQKVYVLRDEIEQQIGAEILPREYVFLKSVGRSITRLKSKQEYQLKAKHFVPPQAYAPELYLLEIGPEDRDRSSQGSTRPQTRSPVYTNAESEDERQSSKAKQMHTSPYRYSPLPKIRSSKSPPRNVSPQRHSGSQKQYSSQRLVTPQKRSDPNSELYPPNDIDHRNDMPQNEVPYDTPSRQKSQDGTPKVEQNGDVRSENRQFMESAHSNRDRRSDPRSHRSSRQSPMPESGKQSPKEEQPTARLSATPPPSADRQRKADRSHHKNEKYDAYTNHTNEDSGINVLTPEDQYEALDRRKQEEDQRQQDLQKRLGPVDDDDDDDRENRQRRLQDERDNDEWERRRREEEERRRREEEERRRREEEENRRAEEERRRLQEDRDRMAKEQKFSGSDEGYSQQRETNTSQIVVKVNDEVNGVLTPRVIVQVNGSTDNVMYDDRYESDHSRRSVASQRYTVERNKTATIRQGQTSNSDYIRNGLNPSNSENIRNGQQSSNSDNIRNGQQPSNNDNTRNGQQPSDSYNTRNGQQPSDNDNTINGQQPSDSDDTKNGQQPSNSDNIKRSYTYEKNSEKDVRDTGENSERQRQTNGPKIKEVSWSDKVKYNHDLHEPERLDIKHSVDTIKEDASSDSGNQSHLNIAFDKNRTNSFEKSDAETVVSSKHRRGSIVSSGYHGDLSDFNEPLADQGKRVKAKGLSESQRNSRMSSRTSNNNDTSKSPKDLNRFPSPPPMHRNARDSESAKRRKKEEIEKLKRELEIAREQRRQVEKQREELVKKAKLMQTKTQNRRNHARDVWKKRYFEEKKKTPPLEEQCNRLRHELDIIHRKLMNTLEGPSKEKSTRTADLKPSQKNNYKIQATRLTHEIDDIRRRLENAKMKLTAEMKLRNQAETELRALRAELTQKKIHLTLSRNQQLAAMTPATSQELYTAPALTHRS